MSGVDRSQMEYTERHFSLRSPSLNVFFFFRDTIHSAFIKYLIKNYLTKNTRTVYACVHDIYAWIDGTHQPSVNVSPFSNRFLLPFLGFDVETMSLTAVIVIAAPPPNTAGQRPTAIKFKFQQVKFTIFFSFEAKEKECVCVPYLHCSFTVHPIGDETRRTKQKRDAIHLASEKKI